MDRWAADRERREDHERRLALSDNPSAMVHTVTKRTSKRRAGAVLKRAAKRARRPGADFSDLVGTAPLHKDPVKFQRALRKEE